MPSHRQESGETQHEHGTAERGIIDAIERNEGLPGNVPAEQALGVVMCVLERALSADDARRLERALPQSIRALVVRCEQHAAHAALGTSAPRDADELVHMVAVHLELEPDAARDLTRVVFHAVHRLMSVGEVREVAAALPEPLRELWTAGDDRGDAVQSSRRS